MSNANDVHLAAGPEAPAGPNGTRRLARVPLDHARLAEDLAVMDGLPYFDSYSEFSFGRLQRGAMLWNSDGDAGTSRLASYAGAAQPTEHGRLLPYVNELITSLFRTEFLKFARLLVLPQDCVVVPHRDYLELDENLIRIHIPLRTSELCFGSAGEDVFHMRVGEMWFLDATQTHSVASFWEVERIHLICDFVADSIDDVLQQPVPLVPGIPSENITRREPLLPEEHAMWRGLARVVNLNNYRDVMALLTKRHFEVEIAPDEVFTWMAQIAAESGRPEVVERVAQETEYYLFNRSEAPLAPARREAAPAPLA